MYNDTQTQRTRLPNIEDLRRYARTKRLLSTLPNDVQAYEQELRDQIANENHERLNIHALYGYDEDSRDR